VEQHENLSKGINAKKLLLHFLPINDETVEEYIKDKSIEGVDSTSDYTRMRRRIEDAMREDGYGAWKDFTDGTKTDEKGLFNHQYMGNMVGIFYADCTK